MRKWCNRNCDSAAKVFNPPLEVELISVSSPKVRGNLRAKWLDADVFAKIFVPDSSYSPFEDEVCLWQRLRHPNVIKIYGACAAGPSLQFFVCENASTSSHLKLEKPTKWKYLHEAALGLEYLHERVLSTEICVAVTF